MCSRLTRSNQSWRGGKSKIGSKTGTVEVCATFPHTVDARRHVQKILYSHCKVLDEYPFRCHSARSGPCLFKRAFSANHNF
jgi:hypothetical protein